MVKREDVPGLRCWFSRLAVHDEHFHFEMSFREQDVELVRQFLTIHCLQLPEYVRVTPQAQLSHPWMRGEPCFIAEHLWKHLDDPSSGWVSSQIGLIDSKLEIDHLLQGLVQGRAETQMLWHLANHFNTVQWMAQAGGYQPYRSIFQGEDSRSLQKFLLQPV